MNLAQMAQTLGAAAADSKAALSIHVTTAGRACLTASWKRGALSGSYDGEWIDHSSAGIEAQFRELITLASQR